MKTIFSDMDSGFYTSLLISPSQKYCKIFLQSLLQLKIDTPEIILGLTI